MTRRDLDFADKREIHTLVLFAFRKGVLRLGAFPRQNGVVGFLRVTLLIINVFMACRRYWELRVTCGLGKLCLYGGTLQYRSGSRRAAPCRHPLRA